MTEVPSTPELVPVSERTIETIINLYMERIGPINDNITYRLNEYKERIIANNTGDWFTWMHKGIMSVATKTRTEQRSIAYLLGLYKAWLTHGFGNCRASEMDKIKSFAESVLSIKLSDAALHKLEDLVTKFGVVSTMAALATPMKPPEDPSLVLMSQLENNLIEVERERTNYYGN